MRRHLAYLQYVLRHKWYVLNSGWSLGIPLLALLHDNSKFLPSEWFPYARHFYNPDGSKRTRLQKDGFYTDDPGDAAFDRAWLTHIRRNKHHPQYWVTVIWTPCGDSGRHYLLKDSGRAKCLACGHEAPYAEPGPDYPQWGVQVKIAEMPRKYCLEMIADWVGAGLAQGTPDVLAWYSSRGKNLPFGKETHAWIEVALNYKET
jgi:hypothetical protein